MKSGKVLGLLSFPQMPLGKSDADTHLKLFTIMGFFILEFSVGLESKSTWPILTQGE